MFGMYVYAYMGAHVYVHTSAVMIHAGCQEKNFQPTERLVVGNFKNLNQQTLSSRLEITYHGNSYPLHQVTPKSRPHHVIITLHLGGT